MDIKSKNIRYSVIMKVIAVIILWASFAGLYSSAVYFLLYSGEFNTKDFYATNRFLNEFKNYTHSVVDYAVRLRNEDYVKQGNSIPADVEAAFGKAGTDGQTDGSVAKDEYINNELQYFRDLKNQLSKGTNFQYIVVDRVTGTFVSNMKIGSADDLQKNVDKLKKQPFNIFISNNDRMASYPAFNNYIDNVKVTFRGTSFEMYAAAMKPFYKEDVFYDSWNEFRMAHELLPIFIAILSLSLLLGIFSFIYLVIVVGRKEKGGQVRLRFTDRIYTDIHTLIVIIFAALSINIAQGVRNPGDTLVMALYFLIILTIDMLIGLNFILSMVRHIKNKTLLKHSFLYKIGSAITRLVKRCMGAKTFRITTIILLIAYGILNSILFSGIGRGSSTFLVFLLWAALNIAGVYWLSKSLVSLSDIMKWVRGISTGNLVDSPDMKTLSPAFSSFAEDVLNLQFGLRNAVSEAVKGERLKTELITNVSHDLKTPLTSIINYVDLLKKEETESQNIRQYTAILEEKSNRLKQLIEDLLEASKAASGNVAVYLESIDLHSLTLQATAEFGEKAAATGLDFRIRPIEKAPLIHADGKLMWRVMENLLSNVLKYSQQNSRVYLDVESTDLYGTITIKNVSSLPLDIPADQLLERFVRGDKSRSEEGSGLGLAIAKSLVEVQGGKLDIMIDGDLFKVCVSIPLENHI